jgi:hypothetical protein
MTRTSLVGGVSGFRGGVELAGDAIPGIGVEAEDPAPWPLCCGLRGGVLNETLARVESLEGTTYEGAKVATSNVRLQLSLRQITTGQDWRQAN